MNPRIELSFPWQSEDATGDTVSKIMIDNLLQAAKVNWSDYDHLQDIRQTCLIVAMQLWKRMGEIRYPDSVKREPEQPILDFMPEQKDEGIVCVVGGEPASFLINGAYYCAAHKSSGEAQS